MTNKDNTLKTEIFQEVTEAQLLLILGGDGGNGFYEAWPAKW
jgi:hypothetical protein